jgi:hypothetical protein
MTYSLEFYARALKEWHKLGDTVRQQLKKKLAEILERCFVSQSGRNKICRCLAGYLQRRVSITYGAAGTGLPRRDSAGAGKGQFDTSLTALNQRCNACG